MLTKAQLRVLTVICSSMLVGRIISCVNVPFCLSDEIDTLASLTIVLAELQYRHPIHTDGSFPSFADITNKATTIAVVMSEETYPLR